MTSPSPIRRRRFQFGVRTLFLAVTVLGVALGWLGVQIKWIHDRHKALQWLMPLHARQLAAESGSLMPSKKGTFVSHSGIEAPWSLEILGETGVGRIVVDGASLQPSAPYTLDELKSLFTEAEVTAAAKE